MDLKLLFDLKVNENLEENWLRFKNETTLLYTYYIELSKDECIGMFKLVQKTLVYEMINNKDDAETLKKIRYVLKDIKSHIEYLRNFKEYGGISACN